MSDYTGKWNDDELCEDYEDENTAMEYWFDEMELYGLSDDDVGELFDKDFD